MYAFGEDCPERVEDGSSFVRFMVSSALHGRAQLISLLVQVQGPLARQRLH